jgi:hypothetical protein
MTYTHEIALLIAAAAPVLVLVIANVQLALAGER